MRVELVIFKFFEPLCKIGFTVTIFNVLVIEDDLKAALVSNSASSPNKLPELKEK